MPVWHSPRFLRSVKVAQFLFVLAVGFYLIYSLSKIGWTDVFAHLPEQPLFYILFAATYIALPFSDAVIYRRLWRIPILRGLPAYFRKRVYNLGLMDYSGEAFLALWARRHASIRDGDILPAIKDVNILSAVTSNVTTAMLLIAFLASGGIKATLWSDETTAIWTIGVVLAGLLLVPAVIGFRRDILSLPDRTNLWILAVHGIRLTGILILQALQWTVVLPGVSLGTWLVFLTAQMVLSRIPFLPNKELAFLGASLGMAGIVNAPVAAVAGMFITAGVLSQLLNAASFVGTSFLTLAPPTAKEEAAEHGS